MIEQLFRLGACLRLTPQAYALIDRPINQLFFWRGFENLVERCVGCCLVDLLHPEIALQSLSPDWPLLHAQRGVAVRITRIIQVAILAQALDNRLDNGFSRAATFQQTLS